jgi:integrase
VYTEAMTRPQWTAFLEELKKINERDCLAAKLVLQGGKRIGEVLSLKSQQIDYQKGEVTFVQSKTRCSSKETIITYPAQIMAELKKYIGKRTGIVFVSKCGHPLHSNQLRISFEKAGFRAGIPFKITPHVLRASTVTYLKQQGFVDSDIMKVTGHASAEMIYAYDKSERAENASKRVCLI